MPHFTIDEKRFLKTLNTPAKIQDYLDGIPFNFETEGETCMSPRRVLRSRTAHCMEGAMLACAALTVHGERPLVLSLKVEDPDVDHVVALYKRNGYWGAISKTNHAVLRFRDPVYKSVRELAMSYFHEYFLLKGGTKTMRGYSKPINLRRFGSRWMTSEKDLWHIAEAIYDSMHEASVPQINKKYLKPAAPIERSAAGIELHKKKLSRSTGRSERSAERTC